MHKLHSIFTGQSGAGDILPAESMILTRDEVITLIRDWGFSFKDFTDQNGDFDNYCGGEVSDWLNLQRREGK